MSWPLLATICRCARQIRQPRSSGSIWRSAQNLVLVSSRLDEELARDEISFRRNGYYPTVDLVANTGAFDTEADRSRGGNISPSPTAMAVATQSAFSSISRYLRAAPTDHAFRKPSTCTVPQRSSCNEFTRETERQTRDAYLGVQAEKSRVEALDQAVKSSTTALEATQAGFEVGTRTIVDVLDSQFALYSAITQFYQARYDYLMNYLRLKQAAGNLQIQDLGGY